MIGTATTAKLAPGALVAASAVLGTAAGAVSENPWVGGAVAAGLMALVWKLVDKLLPSRDAVGEGAKAEVMAEFKEIEEDVVKIKKLVGKSQSMLMAQSQGRAIELAAAAAKAIEAAAGDQADLRRVSQQIAEAVEENRRCLLLVNESLRRDSSYTETSGANARDR